MAKLMQWLLLALVALCIVAPFVSASSELVASENEQVEEQMEQWLEASEGQEEESALMEISAEADAEAESEAQLMAEAEAEVDVDRKRHTLKKFAKKLAAKAKRAGKKVARKFKKAFAKIKKALKKGGVTAKKGLAKVQHKLKALAKKVAAKVSRAAKKAVAKKHHKKHHGKKHAARKAARKAAKAAKKAARKAAKAAKKAARKEKRAAKKAARKARKAAKKAKLPVRKPLLSAEQVNQRWETESAKKIATLNAPKIEYYHEIQNIDGKLADRTARAVIDTPQRAAYRKRVKDDIRYAKTVSSAASLVKTTNAFLPKKKAAKKL